MQSSHTGIYINCDLSTTSIHILFQFMLSLSDLQMALPSVVWTTPSRENRTEDSQGTFFVFVFLKKCPYFSGIEAFLSD